MAQRTDLSPKHINRIVNGHVQISTDVAIRLERATDVPARIWLSLEANYQERLARLDESALLPDLPLLEELPIAAMVRLGILTKRLGKYDRLREVLMYLGVANRSAWVKTLGSLEASFRMGEIEAGEIDCASWDPSRFREVLRAGARPHAGGRSHCLATQTGRAMRERGDCFRRRTRSR